MTTINPQDEVRFYITAVDEVTPVLDKLPEKARDTKKKISKDTQIEYYTNISKLEKELATVRKALKNAAPEVELNLLIKKKMLMKTKTELERELNNYLNTGDIHLSRLQAKFNGLWSAVKNIFGTAWNWLKGAAIGAIGAIAQGVVSLWDKLEQAKISFTTMLGSASKATKLLSELSRFAKGTPFGLTEIRENAKQLLAMNIQASKIIPTLKMLGDVSAGLNVPLQRLALNYWQVMTKGKLAGQELKDFTTAGVPLLDELSKNLGKSKAEIQSMISKGEISANDVTRAFETMTSEWGKFADLMAEQSWTLSWMRSNFMDSLTQIGEKIWSYLLPGLKESVDWIQRLFNPPQNKIEQEISHLDDRVREFQKVIAQVEGDLQELNEKFRNGKISTDEYDAQFYHLSGMLSVAQKSLADVNKEIEEQNALLEIQDDLKRVHTESLTELNEAENKVYEQLDVIKEQRRQGIITEEEYLEQQKKLIEESKKLKKTKEEERIAYDKENTVLEILQKWGKKAHEIKELLANLRIENDSDIDALNAEAQAANNLTLSLIDAVKQKAKLGILEKEKKLDDLNSEKYSYFSKFLNKGDRNALQKEIDKERKTLSDIEKIEKEKNAFLVKREEGEGEKIPNNNTDLPKGGWIRKNHEKEKIEALKKSLKEQRDIEVKAVQEWLYDEETKAKKLADIKERYDERIKQIDGKTIDEMLKNAQDYHKKITKAKDQSLKEDIKVVDKMKKIFRDGWEKIKKQAIQAIKEIEKEKKKLNDDHKTDLWGRFADLSHTVKETEKEHTGIKQLTEMYTLEDLERLNESKDAQLNDIDVSTIIEYKNNLIELDLLTQNLTEEERKKAVELSKQSETQKLINKYKQEELILDERAKILSAIKNSDKNEDGVGRLGVRYDEEQEKYYYTLAGREQEITDLKNQELAQQYIDKETAIHNQAQQELESWQKRIDGEKEVAKEIADIHKISTKEYQNQLKIREDAVKQHVESVKAMMAEIARAQSIANSSTHNNQVINSNNKTTNYNITQIGSTRSSFPWVGLK